MAETKKVTVFFSDIASIQVELIPGDDAELLINYLVEQFRFIPRDIPCQLIGADGLTITSDLYNSIKDGDKLTLCIIGYE